MLQYCTLFQDASHGGKYEYEALVWVLQNVHPSLLKWIRERSHSRGDRNFHWPSFMHHQFVHQPWD